MQLASIGFLVEPVWPWSSSQLGTWALLLVALLVGGLTVVTYLVAQRRSWREFFIIISIRLAALGIVILLMLRPSLASYDTTMIPSKLLIFVDASRSMTISDEFNNQTRWQTALRLLQADSIQARIKSLQDKKVEILYYQGDGETRSLDLEGEPTSELSPYGSWLNQLYQRHGKDENLRGMIVLGDGADNDNQFSVFEEAKRFRNSNCPISTFALGSPTTSPKQRDIAFVADKIFPTPAPVPIKSKLLIKGVVNAPGFENARVRLRAKIGDKEETDKLTLVKSENNEISMEIDAPEIPGEYKVTLAIDPLPGEISQQNNEISTYVTATKEGVSVLWVEGKKRFESTFIIREALRQDPRFRVYYAEQFGRSSAIKKNEDPYDFSKRQYDVIVVGDISASDFCAENPKVLAKLQDLVKEKGTGLLFLGGYDTFANSDWQKYPQVATMFPVELTEPGQIEESVRVRPTTAGYDHFIMRLAENRNENLRRWEVLFSPLKGMTPLGKVRESATVLATGNGNAPVIVGRQFGAGRVLAFGGDTTYTSWRRSYDAIDGWERFWKRTMLWLARQEETEGNVFVRLDSRRLPAGSNARLGMEVGLRSKSGKIISEGQFTVKVVDDAKKETEVEIFPEDGKQRGYFWKTNQAGEFTVVVQGKGKDEEGKEVSGEARARFLLYSIDLENLRPAADHDLLARVAAAGGGEFQLAGEMELEEFLSKMEQKTAVEERLTAKHWPDWDNVPTAKTISSQVASAWYSGTIICYITFCGLLCLEWYLRRRWQMV